MIRERILVYGQPGSGKSYSWLQIAAAYPSKKFYCIDTDEAVERLLATEFPQLQNVLTYPSQDWASCVKALDAIKTKGTSNDWVIVDMLDSIWDYAQSFFVEEVFSKDIGSYFLQARKEMKAGSSNLSALKGWTDWSVVNKLYQSWINEICYQIPAHIFFTAKATKLSTDDDSTMQDMFSEFGARPRVKREIVIECIRYCY